MTAKVDQETCIGCGLCAELCPAVFSMEDEKAVAIDGDVPSDAEESCRDAADQCPVEAIEIEED